MGGRNISLYIPEGDESAFAQMADALSTIYDADHKRGYGTSAASKLPAQYAQRAHRVLSAVKFDDSPQDQALKTAIEAAKEMLRMQGNAAAADHPAKTANHLLSLRDILPGIAARLSIDVGRVARDLEARAQQHRMDSR